MDERREAKACAPSFTVHAFPYGVYSTWSKYILVMSEHHCCFFVVSRRPAFSEAPAHQSQGRTGQVLRSRQTVNQQAFGGKDGPCED